MRSIKTYQWVLAVIFLVSASRARCETLPRLEGETLSDGKIVLPDDAKGKVSLLVIGFSRSGGNATRPWEDRFKKDFGGNPKFALYPVAVLEDAPRLVRGMIRTSMRHEIPKADQDHFVVLIQGEAGLKKFVVFSAPDDAYLILMDDEGEVRWQGHGRFGEEGYVPLQDAAKKLSTD